MNYKTVCIRSSFLKRAICFLLIATCFFVSAPVFAQGAGNGTPCDPDHFDSLRARAWLERQREFTQNQNLILKPDSVLEYTCFGEHVRRTGMLLYRLGTHAIAPPDADNLSFDELFDNLLSRVDGLVNIFIPLAHTTLVPMGIYRRLNYPHAWLGGRFDDTAYNVADGDGSVTLAGLQNLGSTIRTLVQDAADADYSYECHVMEAVWTQAKCMDFIDDPAHDGFYHFIGRDTDGDNAIDTTDYSNFGDHRTLPDPCLPLFEGMFESNTEYATVDEYTPVEEDIITTFFEELDPGHCTDLHPIATGVTVETSNGVRYPERVCAAPGCHYNHDAGECQTN